MEEKEKATEKEIKYFKFKKAKFGKNKDGIWILCTYKGKRFIFDRYVVAHLKMDENQNEYTFNSEQAVVVNNEKGLFIKARTPRIKMIALSNLKQELKKAQPLLDILGYTKIQSLETSFQSSNYGHFYTISYGAAFAYNMRDSIKIYLGNSIKEALNENEIVENFINNNIDRIYCKGFFRKKQKLTNEEIEIKIGKWDLKVAIEKRLQPKFPDYYRCYLKKYKSLKKEKMLAEMEVLERKTIENETENNSDKTYTPGSFSKVFGNITKDEKAELAKKLKNLTKDFGY